jgi:hypothetical protein
MGERRRDRVEDHQRSDAQQRYVRTRTNVTSVREVEIP